MSWSAPDEPQRVQHVRHPNFEKPAHARPDNLDRKSTRLNSSHDQISYAVFCLKKKKRTTCTHAKATSLSSSTFAVQKPQPSRNESLLSSARADLARRIGALAAALRSFTRLTVS